MSGNLRSEFENLIRVAEAADLSDLADRIRERRESAATELLRVAFLGEFNVGKSSLVNCLLAQHEPVMPVLDTPCNVVVAEMRHGSPSWSMRCAAKVTPLTREEFRDHARGALASEAGTILEATVPSPFLAAGVLIADTPGVQSADETHQDITYGYLPFVDVAVLVLDGRQGGLPRTVKSFLQDHLLRSDLRKLVVVINQLDLVPPDDRDDVGADVKRTLADLGIDVPVIGSSAVDEPGTEALRKHLTDTLLPTRQRAVEARLHRELELLCEELLLALDNHRATALLAPKDVDDKLAALGDERAQLEGQLDGMTGRLKDEMLTLKRHVRPAVTTMLAGVVERARRELRGGQPDAAQGLSAKLSGWIAQGMEQLSRDELQPELERIASAVRSEVKAIATRSMQMGEIQVAASGAGSVVLDLLVEGAMIVVLNFILPGEWLVAVVARVLGSKMIDKVKKPIVDAIKDLVGKAAGDMLVKGVLAVVEKQVLDLEGALTTQLYDQLEVVEKNLNEAVRKRFSDLVGEKEHALRVAKGEQTDVAAKRSRRKQQLEEASGAAKSLMARLAPPAAAQNAARAPA